MRRRAFVALTGGALLAGVRASRAQAQRRAGLLGWRGGLMNRDLAGGRDLLAAMKELGYVEGRNFLYDERSWDRQEQAFGMARELLQAGAEVIIAAGPPSILAAKAATDRVPIVMMYSAEPVAMGLVRSLNRPGGNITGLTWDHGFETNVKALELLGETLPGIRRVALLWDETDSVHPVYAKYYEKAAAQRGLTLVSAPVRSMDDVERAVVRMRKERTEALVILPSGQLTVPKRVEVLALAMRERIPTLYSYVGRDAPNALLHFGPNLDNMPRRAAAYVARIFKGAKPADIPIEQPDKYDLVVDLGVARKLGITVPGSVLFRADRVIE
ncbi:MAG TPA: ABC transporter substrate-binding protein [Burkholderiales bacterium]